MMDVKRPIFGRFPLLQILIAAALVVASGCAGEGSLLDENPLTLKFTGKETEHKWELKQLDAEWPSDWSSYKYLVLEMRTSSPQRFFLRLYTENGVRGMLLHPFGQNVWLRASVPLEYFQSWQSGQSLGTSTHRETETFWMRITGPFGDLERVQAVAIAMKYPLNNPTMEIRSVELAKEDPGSEFLEEGPLVDEFGQWVRADWPRKIRSLQQLKEEWAEEEETLLPGDFNYCRYGGYLNTKAEATGYFRVEEIEGRWWFVDPDGHLFLSMSVSSLGSDPRNGSIARQRFGEDPNARAELARRRMEAWGLNTRGPGKPYVTWFRSWKRDDETVFLGMPDVYSEEFVRSVDEAAKSQCATLKNDPLLIGYFLGNEPPWPRRESELVDRILAGSESATQRKLKEFLAEGDTPERREEFVLTAFERFLELTCAAVRKYDPNHLVLGLRYSFGANPTDEILQAARIFDVCTINPYEYDPTECCIDRAFELSGRPILISEFHFGVAENGLAAGLGPVASQKDRGIGYRHYVEQGATHPAFIGAHWFTWRDQPVLGVGHDYGENYNIGIMDFNDRPYPELIEALVETHKRLYGVHSGRVEPYSQWPKASEAGIRGSPWD